MSQIDQYLSQISDYSSDLNVASHAGREEAAKFQEVAASVLPVAHILKQGKETFSKLKDAVDKVRETTNKAKDAVGKVKDGIEKAKNTVNKLRSGDEPVESDLNEMDNPGIAETRFGADFEPETSNLNDVPTQEEAIQASRAAQAARARPTNEDLPEGSGSVDEVANSEAANTIPYEPIEMAPQEEIQAPSITSQLEDGDIAGTLSNIAEQSTNGVIDAVSSTVSSLATPLAAEGTADGIIAALPGIGEIAAPLLLVTGLIGSIIEAINQPDQTPDPSLQLDV